MSDDEVLSILLSGDADQVRRCMLDRGPNAVIAGRPALHWLGSVGNADAVQLLLEMGADPNSRAESGEAALISAAYAGDRRLAQILVEAGADADATDEDGRSVLMAAAKGGHMDLVHLVLKAGANVRRLDFRGRSVLHWAVIEVDNEDMIRCLLSSGAPKDAVSADGLSPRDYAVKLGRSMSAALL